MAWGDGHRMALNSPLTSTSSGPNSLCANGGENSVSLLARPLAASCARCGETGSEQMQARLSAWTHPFTRPHSSLLIPFTAPHLSPPSCGMPPAEPLLQNPICGLPLRTPFCGLPSAECCPHRVPTSAHLISAPAPVPMFVPVPISISTTLSPARAVAPVQKEMLQKALPSRMPSWSALPLYVSSAREMTRQRRPSISLTKGSAGGAGACSKEKSVGTGVETRCGDGRGVMGRDWCRGGDGNGAGQRGNGTCTGAAA